jgi:penicillin amidase
MKIFKKVILSLVFVLVLGLGGVYFYLHTTLPKYSGEYKLQGLTQEVEVYFDDYGIPHIYAQNQEDAYFALGYLHAQERLFQMEIIKRLAQGRLAEILGAKLIETDKFFRTLGIEDHAKRSVEAHKGDNKPYRPFLDAYLTGVNDFVKNGYTPIEYSLLGIEKSELTETDIYSIFGYMSFSFAAAHRTEPILDKMYNKLGEDYLKDWDVHWQEGRERIPSYPADNQQDSVLDMSQIAHHVQAIMESVPAPPWIGSNSWVLSPKKTKSGQVMLMNDTHISFAQPSVWYEAHLETPNFSLYGNYLAGIPFAQVGHSRDIAWGFTMLENDDIDLYREKINPQNPNQVWENDHWQTMQVRKETIDVKGGESVTFDVKSTRHGVVFNEVLATIEDDKSPISFSWTYTKFIAKSLEANYRLGRSKNLEDIQEAAALVHAPGLNLMYGDKEGNIAWFALAKLIKRAEHINSKVILDGASGKDEILGYYDFSENPSSINPPSGYVYSANNQPDTVNGVLHAGYYIPEYRAKRILEYLKKDKKFSVEDMKVMINDNTSPTYASLAKEMVQVIDNQKLSNNSEIHKKALSFLKNWNGEHNRESIEPTIFYKMLFHSMKNCIADELGEEDFNLLIKLVVTRRSFPNFILNDSSIWWDNSTTTDTKETRKEAFTKAFETTISELNTQFGGSIDDWQWQKAHTIEHQHALGRGGFPLNKIFNVGAFGVNGGQEVINNLNFSLNGEGVYKVHSGPAMRIIIDFADVENSLSVLPTGQSGNVMSQHYNNQAEMFNYGSFRKQMMNKDEIIKTHKGKLVFKVVK